MPNTNGTQEAQSSNAQKSSPARLLMHEIFNSAQHRAATALTTISSEQEAARGSNTELDNRVRQSLSQVDQSAEEQSI